MKLAASIVFTVLTVVSFGQQRLKFSIQKEEVAMRVESRDVSDRMTFQGSSFPPSELVSELVPVKKRIYPTVDMSGQNLKTIPFDYCAAGWVAKYDLSSNRIKKLGRRFGKLSTDSLIVCNNQITQMTTHGLYPRLVYLDASNNKIWNVCKDDRKTSSRLRYLDLSFNQIDHLPNFWRIPRARTILLNHNNLASLPQGFRYSSHVTTLDIGHNGFRRIPEEVFKMKALESLDLSHNEIRGSLNKLKRLKSLVYLNLEGNPIEEEAVERLRTMMPNCEIEF